MVLNITYNKVHRGKRRDLRNHYESLTRRSKRWCKSRIERLWRGRMIAILRPLSLIWFGVLFVLSAMHILMFSDQG